MLAERSGYSTRTVYRVLEGNDTEPYDILKADELLLAAGYSLHDLDESCVTSAPSL